MVFRIFFSDLEQRGKKEYPGKRQQQQGKKRKPTYGVFLEFNPGRRWYEANHLLSPLRHSCANLFAQVREGSDREGKGTIVFRRPSGIVSVDFELLGIEI